MVEAENEPALEYSPTCHTEAGYLLAEGEIDLRGTEVRVLVSRCSECRKASGMYAFLSRTGPIPDPSKPHKIVAISVLDEIFIEQLPDDEIIATYKLRGGLPSVAVSIERPEVDD